MEIENRRCLFIFNNFGKCSSRVEERFFVKILLCWTEEDRFDIYEFKMLNGMCIARKKSSIESSCSCSFSESYIPRLSWALSNKIIIRDTIPLRREKKSSSLYRSIVQLNLSNEYTRRYRREKLDETRLVSLRIDFHWKSSAKTRKEVVRVGRNRVPIESIERMRSNW